MSEWISVKDRLPEYKTPCEYVLVCDANCGYGECCYTIAWRESPGLKSGQIWEFSSDLWVDEFVTHWKPLPPLPEVVE